MKLCDFLKGIDPKDYDRGVYEPYMSVFASILAEVVDDDIICGNSKPASRNALKVWERNSTVDGDDLEFWVFRQTDEYYPGDCDSVTGKRHVKAMIREAVNRYKSQNCMNGPVVARCFVEDVFKIFIEIDISQEKLYDEVAEICSDLGYDSDDFFKFFDTHNDYSGCETYDYVDEDLIERLANKAQTRHGSCVGGFCYSDSGYLFSGDPDDCGIF